MEKLKALSGEVVKIEPLDGILQLTIRFPRPVCPYMPHDYVRDWRALQEQQQPFSEYSLKDFARYEKERAAYNETSASLDFLSCGSVDLVQEEKRTTAGEIIKLELVREGPENWPTIEATVKIPRRYRAHLGDIRLVQTGGERP